MKKIEPTISGLTQKSDIQLEADNTLISDMYLPPEDMIDIDDSKSQNKGIISLNIVIMLIGLAYTLLSILAIKKLNLLGLTAVLPLLFGLCIIASGYVPYYSAKYSAPKKNKIMGIIFNFICILTFIVLSISIFLLGNLNPLYSIIPFIFSSPFIFNLCYLIKQ